MGIDASREVPALYKSRRKINRSTDSSRREEPLRALYKEAFKSRAQLKGVPLEVPSKGPSKKSGCVNP